MNAPVSVIMPAYNAAQYLPETIESVLAQIFQDFELLIIDNGSTDKTAEIAYQYSQKDKRVKLFSQQPNQGVAVARNKGIYLTTGKFVAFIDADDQWLPNKLARNIEHLNQDPSLGISFARVEFLNPDGKLTGKLTRSRLRNIKAQHFLGENLTVTVSNIVARREVFEQVGLFEESSRCPEDLDWLLRVAFKKCWKIEGLNDVLVRYRTNPQGLSSDLYWLEKGWEFLIDRAKQYDSYLVNQHYSQARATQLRFLARRAFRLNLAPKVGMDFMIRSLQADWKLILKEPLRTIFTILAVYGQLIMYSVKSIVRLNRIANT